MGRLLLAEPAAAVTFLLSLQSSTFHRTARTDGSYCTAVIQSTAERVLPGGFRCHTPCKSAFPSGFSEALTELGLFAGMRITSHQDGTCCVQFHRHATKPQSTKRKVPAGMHQVDGVVLQKLPITEVSRQKCINSKNENPEAFVTTWKQFIDATWNQSIL